MCDMAWDGNEPAILRLLDEGVDPTRLEDIDGVSWWDVFDSVEINGGCQEGRTALHNARTRGNVSLVRLLVERAPQLLEMRNNVRGLSHSLSLSLCLSTDSWQAGELPTVSHMAAEGGDVDILEMVCEHAPATLEAKDDVSAVCV